MIPSKTITMLCTPFEAAWLLPYALLGLPGTDSHSFVLPSLAERIPLLD